MNGPLEMVNDSGDLQIWMDRLVDGELTDGQQRQLLLALEAQPDRWRRCALAFVEAQSLRTELRSVTAAKRETDGADLATVVKPISVGIRSWRNVPRWIGVAASLLVTFTLGVVSSHMWSSGGEHGSKTDAGTMLVASDTPAASAPAATAPVQNSLEEQSPFSVPRETVQVSLPADEGQAEQTIDVPLVEGNEQKLRSMLADQQPVLSEVALKTLQSTGHQVDQRRAFYPVKLEDGREAVVPLDIVEVRYTGGWQ